MNLRTVYYFKTTKGLAEIAFNQATSRYHALFTKEDLGNYITPEQAIDDLAGGHTFSHSTGVDTSTIGLSDDIGEWTKVK